LRHESYESDAPLAPTEFKIKVGVGVSLILMVMVKFEFPYFECFYIVSMTT